MEPHALHPVVLPVPRDGKGLTGRAKVAALSGYARQALELSAQWSGVRLKELHKDTNGAPLPSEGVFWSLSHKEGCVAGVVSNRPVGIDLELLRGFSSALYARLAAPQEWALAAGCDDRLFLRYWTAKEAVLKAVGKGLSGLGRCRVTAIESEHRIVALFDDESWSVTQCWADHCHLAAVTDQGRTISWHILSEAELY